MTETLTPPAPAKRRSLFDISDDLRAIDDLLAQAADDGGDITDATETLDEWFKTIGAERDAKIEGYAFLIRETETMAAVAKEEAERISRLARARMARVDFLKSRLKAFFIEHKIKKIDTPRAVVTLANNGGLLPLDITSTPEQLPQEYQRRKVEISADGEKIREALDRGEKLPFAKYGERGQRISIK